MSRYLYAKLKFYSAHSLPISAASELTQMILILNFTRPHATSYTNSPFSPSFSFRLRRHIDQIRKTAFHISKLLEVHRKLFAVRRIFNSLLAFRECGQITDFRD